MNTEGQQDKLDRIYNSFRFFSEHGLDGASPIYSAICKGISETPELLAMAAQKLAGQPPPNIFLGCVHDLLLRGYDHPLRAFYPSCSESPATGDPFPAFLDFCKTYRGDILALVRSRRTQTNEVNRSIFLMPAFTEIMERTGYVPLGLIEVGPSAGFNLNWDHYSYSYGDAITWNANASSLELSATLKGGLAPRIPCIKPPIHSKIGVDINPLDPTDPEVARWLKALIWPEDKVRMGRLLMAIQTLQIYPVNLVEGNAVELLPRLIAHLPPEVTPVVFHSFVIYQFTEEDRFQVMEILRQAGKTRDLYRISLEWLDDSGTRLELDIFESGNHERIPLAKGNPHGKWIEWLHQA